MISYCIANYRGLKNKNVKLISQLRERSFGYDWWFQQEREGEAKACETNRNASAFDCNELVCPATMSRVPRPPLRKKAPR